MRLEALNLQLQTRNPGIHGEKAQRGAKAVPENCSPQMRGVYSCRIDKCRILFAARRDREQHVSREAEIRC